MKNETIPVLIQINFDKKGKTLANVVINSNIILNPEYIRINQRILSNRVNILFAC